MKPTSRYFRLVFVLILFGTVTLISFLPVFAQDDLPSDKTLEETEQSNQTESKRKYTNIVALGQAFPIDSEEGLVTPLYIYDHLSKGYFGQGTLSIALQTSTLTTGMRHAVSPKFAFEYQGRGTVVSQANGTDIYLRGKRLKEVTFYGESGALIVGGHFFSDTPLHFVLEAENMRTWYRKTEVTNPYFRLPDNFQQTEYRLIIEPEKLYQGSKTQFSLTATSGAREGWKDWGLEKHYERKQHYLKWELKLEHPIEWSDFSQTEIKFKSFGGNNLDLFSGYGVGGSAGDYPVGGYFRNEYRVEDASLVNFAHSLNFAEDRVLSFYADYAQFEQIDLKYFETDSRTKSIGGVGIGFVYGVRSLGGLPIVVRYYEGLKVPEDSEESHRRELLFMVAAGF